MRVIGPSTIEGTFLVYEGTLQADALALVAAKMRSALMIEGKLPEDGLAALEGDGQDVFLTLARRLTEQSAGDGQSLEALFAQTRQNEVEAEGYLVDGDWVVEVTPTLTPQQDNLPVGAVADLWQRVFADEMAPETSFAGTTSVVTNGRVVTFEELATLIRRTKQRRKPVLQGQLVLFDG